jgi:RNA polymerase sigma-70 factor (ECF subfamily)
MSRVCLYHKINPFRSNSSAKTFPINLSLYLSFRRGLTMEAEFASTPGEVMRGSISYPLELKAWISSLTYPSGEIMIAEQILVPAITPMSAASSPSNSITAMLRKWSDGEQHAPDELIRAVYDQLRRQARRQLRRERPGHTLDTSALINEAYLKLIEQRTVKWNNRGHFFALAAELMRRILVDHARTKQRLKRGGQDQALPLEDFAGIVNAMDPLQSTDLIALDQALDTLASLDPQQVRIVELRYFAGLDISETAEALNISPATVKRDWAAAKAWLKHEMTRESQR